MANCIICGQPAQMHHVKGGSMRDAGFHAGIGIRGVNKDWVIPLCMNHHTGDEGIHTLGVRTWEERYGKQIELLEDYND